MKNINSFRSLFWIAFLCWGCSDLERGYCFPDVSPPFQNEDRLSFFFLDVDSLSCIYKVGFVFFEPCDSYSYKLLFDKDCCVVSFGSENWERLFCFSDSVGVSRKISFCHKLFYEETDRSSMPKLHLSVQNVLKKKDEIYVVLRFYEVIFLPDFDRPLDLIVFFSNRRGPIGCYYFDPGYPSYIIEAKGDILEDKIDYSKFSFRRLL